VAGVASAWVLVFVSAWSLERLQALGRGDLGGVAYAGVGAGVVVAGLVCLLAMSIHATSSVAWTSLGIAAIAATVMIWTSFGHGTVALAAPAPDRAKPPDFRRLVLCYGAYGFGYIIPATFLPVMAKQVIADPALFGWAWPVFGAAAVVSTFVAARATRRFAFRAVWAASHLVMAAGVVVPVVLPGLPGIPVRRAVRRWHLVGITQVGRRRRARSRGTRPLIAAMTSAFALGQSRAPAAGYAVRATGGFSGALVLAAALLAGSALALTPAGSRRA
jgi:hypothetical protein